MFLILIMDFGWHLPSTFKSFYSLNKSHTVGILSWSNWCGQYVVSMWLVCCQYVVSMLLLLLSMGTDYTLWLKHQPRKLQQTCQQSWLGKCSPKSTKNNKYTCGNFKTMANFKNVLNYKYRSLSNCVINKTIVRNFWLFGGETIYRGTLHRGPSHGDVSWGRYGQLVVFCIMLSCDIRSKRSTVV